MRVLKASCNTRAHTRAHTALWNWSDKLTQRVKKKERRNGDGESVCFNSLNAFLLSCRLVSVCTVRGRLPPSHHVSTCSSKYSIATSIATTRLLCCHTNITQDQYASSSPSSKHCMNPYLYINQTRCRGETFVAITIVTCACSLGNKVNIKKQDPKVATKGNRMTRATSQGSKPLTF